MAFRAFVCVAAFAAIGCGSRGPGLTGAIRAGTGGGFQQFCKSETDVQNASRPINANERAACERAGITFIEIPVAFDAVTIIVNPANAWTSLMTIAELKKLWEPAAEGKVIRWSDVRADWPNEQILLFGPGSNSGTFDYFTEAINGAVGASRKDYTASEDDTVIVNGVAADRFALGYVGYGYFHQSEKALKAIPIAGPNADRLGAVMPSTDNVQRGAYSPLARTLFIYVNAKSLERPEISEFVTFYLKQDQNLVREVGGIPMSPRAYELVRQRVAKRIPGTLFPDGRAAARTWRWCSRRRNSSDVVSGCF